VRRTLGSFTNFCYKDPKGNGKSYCKPLDVDRVGLNTDTACKYPSKYVVQTYSKDDDAKFIGSTCYNPALNCDPYDRSCKVTYKTAGMCNLDGFCTRRTFDSYTNFCYRNPKDNKSTCQKVEIDYPELNLDKTCKSPKYGLLHIYQSSDDAVYVGKACNPTTGIHPMDFDGKKKNSYMCNADSYCTRRTLGSYFILLSSL
jgi:hypothetical protein